MKAVHLSSFAQFSFVAPLRLLLAVLLVVAPPAKALVIENNCPDSVPSRPMPKRLESGCEEPLFPDGFSVLQFGADSQGGDFFIDFFKQAASPFYGGLSKISGRGALLWSFAVPQGELQPSRFNSHRYLGIQTHEANSGNAVCIGAYSDTSGTMRAQFERELPIADRDRVSFLELEDGTILVALDKIESIVVLALSSTGELAWCKEYRSEDFSSSPPSDSVTRDVNLARVRGSGAIIHVGTNESRADSDTSRTALMRIDSQGEPEWSRKFEVRGSVETSGASVFGTGKGALFVMIGEVETGKGLIKERTFLFKISEAGEVEWGRSLGDLGFVGCGGMNDAGEVILSLRSMKISKSGVKFGNFFVVLDSKGKVSSAVRLNLPRGDVVISTHYSDLGGSEKIYYVGQTDTKGATHEEVIGSSSRSLTDFRWLRYKHRVPRCYSGLARLSHDRLVFWAHSVKPDWTDFVMLKPDLTEIADCKLFSPEHFTVSDAKISVHPVEARLIDTKVDVKPLSLTLKKAELVFKKMSFSEKDLCMAD